MAERPIPVRRQAAAVVAAGFGQNIGLTTVTTFVLVYLIEYAGVSSAGMAVVTAIITVAKVLDAITDPVMGAIVDMTRTRWGKLRPYLLFSAAPVAALTALMFSVPDAEESLQLLTILQTHGTDVPPPRTRQELPTHLTIRDSTGPAPGWARSGRSTARAG